MKMRSMIVAVAAVSAGAMGIPAVAAAYGSHHASPKAVGLAKDGTALVRVNTADPGKSRRIGEIRGLSGDTALIGIDRRVQNGALYGVGDQGGVYLLSRWARASKVGELSVALDGTAFGVDFNPAANALRIVSDTGQNLRQPFGTGDAPSAATVADGTLTYTGVTAAGVTAAAYTNNDLNTDTATSLFDLDTTADQVALQSPANTGSLAPTGKLGVDAVGDAGFDIYSELKNGKTESATGYAVLGVGGRAGLYSVDLLTGDVDLRGSLPYAVSDLAVDLDR